MVFVPQVAMSVWFFFHLLQIFEYFCTSRIKKDLSFQIIIGSGENLCDFTYVENVAHATICAEEVLSSEAASVAGKVLFWRIFYQFSVLFAMVICWLFLQPKGLFIAIICSHFSSQIMNQWSFGILMLTYWKVWDIKGESKRMYAHSIL